MRPRERCEVLVLWTLALLLGACIYEPARVTARPAVFVVAPAQPPPGPPPGPPPRAVLVRRHHRGHLAASPTTTTTTTTTTSSDGNDDTAGDGGYSSGGRSSTTRASEPAPEPAREKRANGAKCMDDKECESGSCNAHYVCQGDIE